MNPGTRLGPYEIVAPIGAGGMGEVYRARDTRLNRDVAVKVLPAHLKNDPALRARFDREAKAISSLNHSHICQLYDVGSENGVDYLVLEFLEGETLEHRLQRGPLPPRQALEYGIEVAEALDRAHHQGIVHRDLKPGNVMLTKAGAKLMDFGLAKPPAALAATAGSDTPTLASVSRPLTVEGAIIGTYQYMAPEQLQGQDADARSDIFAFGSVLYEMAAGRRAFSGKSAISVMSAILERDPEPLTRLQPLAPPALDHVIQRALEKDPEKRWQSAADLAAELRWILQQGSQAAAPAFAAPRRKITRHLGWAVAAIFAVALLVLLFSKGRTPEAAPSEVSFSIAPGQIFQDPSVPVPMAVSPDGRALAYLGADASGRQRIYLRSLDRINPVALTGTEGAGVFFWSPDSRYIAFFVAQKLKRIGLSNSSPEDLCALKTRPPAEASWGPGNVMLLAFFETGTPLQELSLSDCSLTPALKMNDAAGERRQRHPQFLPDGSHFLFSTYAIDPQVGRKIAIYVGRLGSTERQLLVRDGWQPTFIEPGYLLFAREGRLFAQEFNARTLKLSGEPVPALDQRLAFVHGAINTAYSASANGTIAFEPDPTTNQPLAWLDRSGKVLGRIPAQGNYDEVAISPDGTRIAAQWDDVENHEKDLWLYDLQRQSWSRLTFNPTVMNGIAWSPDSKRIAFAGQIHGFREIFIKQVDSADPEQVFLPGLPPKNPTDWSRDGKLLVFDGLGETSSGDLFGVPLAGGKPYAIAATPANEIFGAFSPDSRWVAYMSDQTGRVEIFVRSVDGTGNTIQVSSGGGSLPRWNPKGKELFYLGPGNTMMAVDVQTSPTFRAGIPHALFTIPGFNQYAVDPSGTRFLISYIGADAQNISLTVTTNWHPPAGH